MFLSICGFNHRTASLIDREPFQISRAELAETTRQYKEFTGAEETAVISTCNRVEFYRVVKVKNNHYEELIRFYQDRGIPDASILRHICYSRQGTTCARHLFRVASGLDSLVLGEDQILHQVKEAYSAACAVGGPGQILHKLFHLAFQIAKTIRNETNFAEGPRNVPGAAWELLIKRMEGCYPNKALVVGVNNISEIILDHLARRNIPAVIANRSPENAQKLAAEYRAKVIPLQAIPQTLAEVDAVFCAAAAGQNYLIGKDDIFPGGRSHKPLFMVDLAVPRNIDPAAGEIAGVQIIDLQDLKRHLELSANSRNQEIPKAEELIERQVTAYSLWRSKTLKQEKFLKMRESLNQLRQNELEKARISFRKSDFKALEAFSQTIMRDFLRFAPYLMNEDEVAWKELIGEYDLKEGK